MSEEQSPPEIQINVKGPNELKLQITISPDKTVLELKTAIAEKSDVEAERQRLIYSGRVLKDEDLLSVYKIQSAHTIHMVKGAARSGASSSSTSTGSASAAGGAQALPTMQTGQNVHDPLTQLNGHMGFGAMAGLNPFADLGVNQNDPNMLQTMMSSPQFMQQMSAMMSNPAIMEQVISSNPQLAGMGPQLREAFNSPHFREMLANPQRLQEMFRMASMFGGAGGMGGAFGGAAGGAGGFPAPGVPGGGSAATATPQSPPTGAPAANPFNMFGGAPPTSPGAAAGAGGAGAGGFDPALMQQLLGMGGGFGGGGNAFGGGGNPFGGANAFGGGFGAPAAPAAPSDTRAPEERFQVQLQQLQDMGFTNASQNVRALLATGGNVHGAIEYILGGGGL